ncbi:helix-turn-helix transcriptional regulator [Paenibacillus sp. 481]|uniref:helix-turn-helix transcriptional regulator n=1 Tax=Paenibacillus sp. 481 TaxID=2835869 RepID=UPI001E2BFDCA|nr:helix-turn-helix transcriptional regulator [Paenibacillus sp. 481]UHA75610.1 helix-turn-helix transcriptional regulator [Paenibacillus sp. 481]
MIEPRNWLIRCRGSRTQIEVAQLSLIQRSSYSNIERGRRDPSVSVAKRIGQALGFQWQRFFEGSDAIDCDRVEAVLTRDKHSRLTNTTISL